MSHASANHSSIPSDFSPLLCSYFKTGVLPGRMRDPDRTLEDRVPKIRDIPQITTRSINVSNAG